MPNTNGFKPGKLNSHWGSHYKKFVASVPTPAEYERMADAFFGPRPPRVVEGSRYNGDLIRFDPATAHFGVLDKQRQILTFYPAEPSKHLAGSNADYFVGETLK